MASYTIIHCMYCHIEYSFSLFYDLCIAIVFEILYGKVFPQLEVSVPVNKSSNGIEQAEIPSDDSVEQSGGNDNASENGEEEEEGWTTVKSRKQGILIYFVFYIFSAVAFFSAVMSIALKNAQSTCTVCWKRVGNCFQFQTVNIVVVFFNNNSNLHLKH